MPAGHFCLWRYTPKQVRPPRFAILQTEQVSPSPTWNRFFLPSRVQVLCVPNEELVADTCSQKLRPIFVSPRSFLLLTGPSHWVTSVSPIKTDHATTKASVFFSPFGMLLVSTCVSTLMHTHLSPSRQLPRAMALGQKQTHTTIINCAAAPLIESSH